MSRKTRYLSVPSGAFKDPYKFVVDWLRSQPESSLQLVKRVDMPASTLRNLRNGRSFDVTLRTWLAVVSASEGFKK